MGFRTLRSFIHHLPAKVDEGSLIHANDNRAKVEHSQKNPLTNREQEILEWVALGKSNGVIAEILSISESTVDYHLRMIFKKLGVNNRLLAVVQSMTQGMLKLGGNIYEGS